MSPYHSTISKFKGKKIVVIGDIILDQYIQGTVSRISPEAPVPIVQQQGEASFRPGGAANVANNLSTLGAEVTLIGAIGRDVEGEILIKELKKRKISPASLVIEKDAPTILKTRIFADHQQVVRVDKESIPSLNSHALSSPFLQKIEKSITRHINACDAVIISDYGKGVVSPALLSQVCSLAIAKKKIIAVDPKVEHFTYYKGVTTITPNKKEAENAIRYIKIRHNFGHKLGINSDSLQTDADVDLAGQQLLKFLGLESLLITLGQQGMRLFEKGKKPIHINTRAREVFDVTGAGDTVVSVFTLALTTGASKHEAADIANYAAGIVVGKLGAIAVTRQDLQAAVKSSPMKIIGVIPARYGSTRLEAKVLADLLGKPVVQHVWEGAKKARLLNDLIIACDDDRIKKVAQSFGAKAVMTSVAHTSGTDRVIEAVSNLDVDIVINIQGDEPLVHATMIDDLARMMIEDKNCVMGTVVKPLSNPAEIEDPNVVKAVLGKDRCALYFSRSPIPYNRSKMEIKDIGYYKHLGLYAYQKEFLLNFKHLPASRLEKSEQLEQLRVLEAGFKIKAVETKFETIAVDTKEDLQKVETFLKENKRG